MNKIVQSFYALVQRDMAVFWPSWLDRFINAIIWSSLMLVVFEYVMPNMGLQGAGMFMACAAIASWGFFEVTENIARFIADLEGQQSISYYLTLPMPQWAVFARIAVTNALQAMFISILFLPLFSILLFKSFTLAQFSIVKFAIIFLLVHFFYGFFSLYIAARMESLDKIGNVWLRLVYPMWWIGCFQFSWQTLASFSPRVAQINLFNPMVYCMEGMRVAILGQEGYLNFWHCVGALLFFTALAGYVGIKKLKRRLDCL